MRSYGLTTYIWNNRLKSLLLLLGFPFLLLLICYGFALIIAALDNPDIGEGFRNAANLTPTLIPIALVASLIWWAIAWFANRSIINAVTGAHPVDRAAEPRLWNLLENLCISRGITMPSLSIIESPARNAFASGVRKSQYAVTVTRGLMEALDDAELEAVLAHELTHIRNRDVQLLVIAAVFVGIISLVGDLIVRAPRALLYTSGRSRGYSGGSGGFGSGGSSSSSSSGSSRGGKGGGGAIVLILVAVAIFLLARVLAIALRLAVSRKREYLADAGSVELTRNPDAMIGALRKISGHSEIEAPNQVRAMFIDYPERVGFASFFATHPPIESRIDALVRYAGGLDLPVHPELPPAGPPPQIDDGQQGASPPARESGPWG